MKIIKQLCLPLMALALIVPGVQAKKKDKASEKAPMMDEAMKEVMKRGAPSESHKIFTSLEGKWDVAAKFWMEPGQKVQKSKATAQNELIKDGRFLKQTYSGDWNGAPYTGTGFTGYDNIREEYENVWLDNFSTGIMKATGKYDAKSKTLGFTCSYSCAMTGEKNKWSRSEWIIKSDKKNIYKSYSKDTKGKEFLAMELTYSRAK